MQTLIIEWLEFAVRWAHVITAIAWIGSSFYFIALDLGLRRGDSLPEGANGEEWQVHGGGFYHINKYLVAPPSMPDHLTWFKWESYFTWLSGAALLMLVYWVGGEIYLIDPQKADLSLFQAILISGSSLTVGWLVYNYLCQSGLSEKPMLLMLLLFIMLVVMSFGYNAVFTGRAALLHVGAFTATIMTANVFFIIMPNQRIVVADLKAGRKPDPKYGKIAKIRSTHNNYLTLPVIFLMLSTHYPLAFGTQYAWLITSLVFLTGVTIRHFFNTMHLTGGYAHGKRLWWTWILTALIFGVMAWLSSFGPADRVLSENQAGGLRGKTKTEWHIKHFETAAGFEESVALVQANCSMCHAREPLWEGIGTAPKGVVLETPRDIAHNAKGIFLHAAASAAMPPPNAGILEPDERRQIAAWYNLGRKYLYERPNPLPPATDSPATDAPVPAAPVQLTKAEQHEADLIRGKKLFRKCAACHDNDSTGRNRIGPNLRGIVGKDIASVADYNYSSALTALEGSWSKEKLTAFLNRPKTYVHGTKMVFSGLKRPEDLRALITYLDRSR